MKEKYNKINMSKVPAEIKGFLKQIKEATENFDPDYVPIEQDNFDDIYSIIEKKHPEALGKAAVVKKVKPSTEKKVVKKPKKAVTKKPSQEGNVVDDCRDVLKEAGYSVKKRLSKKGGKPMVTKKKRPERTIIKERVEDTFKPILKDISGSNVKDEKYFEMQKTITSIQGLFASFLQKLNNLAEDNSIEKVKKIEKLLKEILSD